jgi:hypothetical protein
MTEIEGAGTATWPPEIRGVTCTDASQGRHCKLILTI